LLAKPSTPQVRVGAGTVEVLDGAETDDMDAVSALHFPKPFWQPVAQ
jgi:hypothetical protein